MSKNTYLFPALALATACILWGLMPPFIKMGLESVPITIAMSIRFLLAALIILPFAIRSWKPLTKKEFAVFVLGAILFNSLGSLALNIGLSKTTSINAAVIDLMSPLLLFVFAVLLLKEAINKKTLTGILVSLLGSIIIIGQIGDSGVTSDMLVGNLFVLGSVFCLVLGTVIFKPLTTKASTYQTTFITLFFGTLPVMLYSLTQLDTWSISDITARSAVGLIAGAGVVVGANTLYFYALKRKKVQSTGIYVYLSTITTVISAWILLGERPTPNFWVGTCLVVLGVYLSEANKYKAPQAD